MKKYGVIHYSDDFIFGQWIKSFDELEEAKKYVKDFVGDGDWHKNDSATIFERISTYEADIIDQTPNGKLYGLKENK